MLVGSQSPLDEDSSPPMSPACHQEIAGGFPELFRQAILEVDQLTQQLGEEARRGEEGDSSEGGEEKVVQHKSRPGSKRRRKKALEAAEQARQGGEAELKGETTPRLTPIPRYLSFSLSRRISPGSSILSLQPRDNTKHHANPPVGLLHSSGQGDQGGGWQT